MNLFRKANLLFILSIGMVLCSCSSEETNTCENDKLDSNWGSIVSSSLCSSEQKGEAYLALGGFDYFDLITTEDPTLIKILGLSSGNWLTKYGYFVKAANLVRSRYTTGTDAEKNIFFLGSFLATYTYMTGKLDNGEGGSAVAFDGNMESSEISALTGTSVSSNTGGGDGTNLVPTNLLQVKSGDDYYLINIVNSLITDISADSNADGIQDGSITLPVYSSVLENVAQWSVVNQVAYMNSMEDPLGGTGGSAKVDEVKDFSTVLLNLLVDIEASMVGLGLDSSADTIEKIVDFRNKLDNGGSCTQLKDNPLLLLAEEFSTSQKLEIAAGGSYADANVFSLTRLAELGKSNFADPGSLTGNLPGITVNIGVKILFKRADNDYIPYWTDATTDIKSALESVAQFDTTSVRSNDKKISFSEIICAAELFSSD